MIRNQRAIRHGITIAAGSLLALWGVTHNQQLLGAPDTLIRFSLTGLFAFLILLRPKPKASVPPLHTSILISLGAGGVILHAIGIVFGIHQAEWLGLLAVVAAALGWALPGHYARDAAKALFLLYWAHPLPSRLIGSFQITMQQLSVTGAEWLLHILNIRVWADGLVLKTGLHVFEVPAWCSGMRTATTVFLLALGLGMIKRLTLYQKIVAILAALVQALALNILRISMMVLLVPQLADVDSIDFLHNTAGSIVIAAVFLVYIEIELMRRAKQKADLRAGELTPDLDTMLREHPPFWRYVVDHPVRIGSGIIVLVMLILAGIRLRPHHRAEMYRGVTETLRDNGKLADAERLGWKVLAMNPDNPEWTSSMLRMLVMRGKYLEALSRIDTLSQRSGSIPLERQILKAYALMGLHRYDDARSLVNAMPAKARDNDPRVAMVLAEMAFYANDPNEVAHRVLTAAQWGPNIGRIRALYPYLRTARKWTVIAKTDPRTPYPDPVQALSAAEAFMNMDEVRDVAVLSRQAVLDWPRDPRLLIPLFYLTGKRPDDGWEQRYAQHLRRCLPGMENPDTLYALVENCFLIRRPDLVWSIYKRIQAIDSDYPGLAMMAVRYGHRWFAFRRRYLGIPSGSPWDAINLAPYYHVGLLTPIWAKICQSIPLGSRLSVSNTIAIRKQILSNALQQFRALSEQDRLSLRMQYEYAFAQEINGSPDAAQQILQQITDAHPEEAESVRIAVSEMYERQGDWQNVYETLRTYPHDTTPPRLAAMLRLISAELNLRLGLGAIATARQTVKLYPQSGEAASALALVLNDYDSPEAALRAVSRNTLFPTPDAKLLEAEALFHSQRFAAYRETKKERFLTLPPVDPGTPQGYSLPPAELAINWHLVFIPSEKQFADYAARIRSNLPRTTSPFLRNLYTLWLASYEMKPDEESSVSLHPPDWQACGRDRTEQGIALNQLYLLLCRRQNYPAALAAAKAATEIDPETATHWRYRIGLSQANSNVITQARQACPNDNEIWLAWLFSQCKAALSNPDRPPERPQLIPALTRAIADNTLTAATLTRSAELLLRAGYRQEATDAARAATQNARTLLPAYIMGLRCAILAEDRKWAQACTLNALQSALNPPPALYRKLVEIKADDGKLDIDDAMVHALKQLRRSDPDNPLWPRMLSLVRFKRGGWEVLDSLNQAAAAITAGATNRMTYIVGAEAARLLRNPDRAVDLLQQGLARYPTDIVMLNNLAYTLADAPNRAEEALKILPMLLPRTTREPWLIDTIALIYLRNDRLKEAEQALSWIPDTLPQGSPEAFRYVLREAEIAFRRDNLQKCGTILRKILKESRGISDEDILDANRLLSKADETLRQLEQQPSFDADVPTETSQPER